MIQNKKINFVARALFVFFFIISSSSLLVWEVWNLNQSKNKGTEPLVRTSMASSGEISLSLETGQEEETITMETELSGADARPLIIQKYLEKYKSPLAPYSDLIFELSEDYGFEYYWIVAIAQQESNLCKKIPEGSHNCWGYGIHKGGTLRFDNYELALRSFADYLKRVYFDKGLNTTELIMAKYCPHSDGSWAYGVNQFIQEMESGDF